MRYPVSREVRYMDTPKQSAIHIHPPAADWLPTVQGSKPTDRGS
jgi:hypothetical protein